MKKKILILMALSICLCIQCGTETDQIDEHEYAGWNCGSDCSDGNPCTMDTCVDGECQSHPSSVDVDWDGYMWEECGGDDCDDHNYEVNPGSSEGHYGALSCADQVDNDCDSLTDAQDPDCASIQPPPNPPPGSCPSSCCKCCSKGKACGDSCISRSYTCHQPSGCACNAR